MSKRSASSSPAEGSYVAKKAKSEATAIDITDQQSQQQEPVDGKTPEVNSTDVENTKVKTPMQIISGNPVFVEATPQPDTSALLTVESTVKDKKKNTEPKQSTKEAFNRDWKPNEAAENVPAEALPHWGIVPRSTNYGPTESQPSAKASDAEVRPHLWEDRKGEIRLQGPTRYIEGYDQAQHMYLPLMDQRCAAGSIKPRRTPVHYWYKAGGMLLDWNNPSALNDLNKALKGAIRANSKESAWQMEERERLARICGENQDASIWDIASLFNDEVYPLAEGITKEAGYPTGRTIESVVHEYRCYKSSYQAGNAPTKSAIKDIQLAQLIQKREEDGRKAKDLEKLADKEAKESIRKANKAAKIADKKKAAKKSTTAHDGKPTELPNKISETAGVKKTKKGKGSAWDDKTEEEKAAMIARADATGVEIWAKSVADEAAKTAKEILKVSEDDTATKSVEPGVVISQDLSVPEVTEQTSELLIERCAQGAHLSLPLSVPAQAEISPDPCSVRSSNANILNQIQMAPLPENGTVPTYIDKAGLIAQPLSDIVEETPSSPANEAVIGTQTTVETEVILKTLLAETTIEQAAIQKHFVGRPTRDVEIDENYDEDDLL